MGQDDVAAQPTDLSIADAERLLEKAFSEVHKHVRAVVIALDDLAFHYCKLVFDAKQANPSRDLFYDGWSDPGQTAAPPDVKIYRAGRTSRSTANKILDNKLWFPTYVVGSGRRLAGKQGTAERDLLVGDAVLVRQICVGRALLDCCTLYSREHNVISIARVRPDQPGRRLDRVHYCDEIDAIFEQVFAGNPAVAASVRKDLTSDPIRNLPKTTDAGLVRAARGVVKDEDGCTDLHPDVWVVEQAAAGHLMEILRKPERNGDKIVDVLSAVGVTQTSDRIPTPGADDLANLHSTILACAMIRMSP